MKVISTSPFKNAVVFTIDAPAVTSVAINPATVTASAGLDVQFSATVNTTGFANKSVIWSVETAPGQTTANKVTIDINGKVHIPSDYDKTKNPIKIKATSVYDNTKTATATITVA